MSRPSQSIKALLLAAAEAPPPEREIKTCWACFYPVIQTLISNGRNVFQAVEWLVQKQAIKADQQRKAYRALLALHKRKTKTP